MIISAKSYRFIYCLDQPGGDNTRYRHKTSHWAISCPSIKGWKERERGREEQGMDGRKRVGGRLEEMRQGGRETGRKDGRSEEGR